MQSSLKALKFVSASEFAARRATQQLYVLDCSTEAPTTHASLSARDYYLQAHIPSSLFLDISNLCDKTSPYMNTIPGLEQFTARMKELGVGLDKPVVCYDNRDFRWAARAAWLLEVYGHPDVSILSEKIELTESGEASAYSGSDFGYVLREHLLTRFEQVQSIVKGDTQATILDARPPQ